MVLWGKIAILRNVVKTKAQKDREERKDVVIFVCCDCCCEREFVLWRVEQKVRLKDADAVS
jgi:hypothetical protein